MVVARLAQHGQQFVGVPRLSQVAVDLALVDGVEGWAQVRVARQHELDRVGGLLSGQIQELDTVEAGHLHVRDNDRVRPIAIHHRQRLLATHCRVDGDPLAQAVLNGRQQVHVVIDA